MSYAGDLTPQQAWDLLTTDEHAVLVDVRTDAEWRYVGIPDAAPIGGRAALVEWVSYPSGRPNPQFLEQLADAGVTAGRPGRVPVPLGRALDRRRAGRDGRGPRPGLQRARGLRGRRRPRRPPRPLGLARRRPALAAGVSARRVPGPGDWDDRRAPRTDLRPDTLAVRGGLVRSQFDEMSEALFLTQGVHLRRRRRGRGRVRRRGRPLPLLALRQPDGVHVRGAAAPARGRRGRVRDGDGHVRGVHRRSPRSCSPARASCGPRAVRLHGRDLRRDPGQVGRAHRLRRRARAVAVGGGAVDARGRRVLRDAVQPHAGPGRHRRGQPARARRRRDRRSSTTSSPRPCSPGRSSSAPTSSCTPRPSTSTGRGACSAARSSAPRSTSTGPSRRSSGTPARRCRRSTRGCCSRASRRCRCACGTRRRRRCSVATWLEQQPGRLARSATRTCRRTRSTSSRSRSSPAAAPS